MKKWIKENAVGLVSILISSGTVIWAFTADLYRVICAGPLPFWIWSIGVAILFSALTFGACRLHVRRKLGMAIEEAAKQLDDSKRAVEAAEDELLSSDIGVKLACLAAGNNHLKERPCVYKATDLEGIFLQGGSRKAADAGFVRIEPCGLDEVRIEPTQKLLCLLERRPDVLRKLSETAVRVNAPDLKHLSWHDIKLDDIGGFRIADSRDDVAFKAAVMDFAQGYKDRPFWQRYLVQQLVDGHSAFMLSDQYTTYLKQDFEDRDFMVAATQVSGNAFELSATEGIRCVFEEFPGIRDAVDDLEYIDAPEDHLRRSFGAKIEVGPVSWYVK